jgi:hypothetical protein
LICILSAEHKDLPEDAEVADVLEAEDGRGGGTVGLPQVQLNEGADVGAQHCQQLENYKQQLENESAFITK